jgi:hypothetical protein
VEIVLARLAGRLFAKWKKGGNGWSNVVQVFIQASGTCASIASLFQNRLASQWCGGAVRGNRRSVPRFALDLW